MQTARSSQTVARVSGNNGFLPLAPNLGRTAYPSQGGGEQPGTRVTAGWRVWRREGSGDRLSCTGPQLLPNSPIRGSRHPPGGALPPPLPQGSEREDWLGSLQGPVQTESLEPPAEQLFHISKQQ